MHGHHIIASLVLLLCFSHSEAITKPNKTVYVPIRGGAIYQVGIFAGKLNVAAAAASCKKFGGNLASVTTLGDGSAAIVKAAASVLTTPGDGFWTGGEITSTGSNLVGHGGPLLPFDTWMFYQIHPLPAGKKLYVALSNRVPGPVFIIDDGSVKAGYACEALYCIPGGAKPCVAP